MTLAEIRKIVGLTQDDMAKHLGVERPSVTKWELGINQPTIDKIPPLAKLLDVTEGEIIAAIAASRDGKAE